MHLTWDLTFFFENSAAFYKKMEDIKQMICILEEGKDSCLDDKSLLELLNKREEIKEQTNNILIYGSLRYYKNIKDEECIELKRVAETFHNEINLRLGFVNQKILDLGQEQIVAFIQKNKDLQIYEQSLSNLFRMQEHVQNEEINKKINENCDLINEQLSNYNAKLRDINYGEIEIDGKKQEITASTFAKYMASRDRETRKQTYFTVNQSFKESEEEFATILNDIYGYRIENAKLEQYQSILEKALYEENIDPKIISSLIEAVHRKKYLMQEYLKLKAEFLEIDDPHLYDFGVTLDSDLKTKYTISEAIEIIKEALKPLGEKYLQVVDILLDGHIDAEADEDKHQSITFSWNTYSFMNFRGAYGDLKNMIHEIGHIVHYYFSKENLPFLYEDSTIFVAEIASTINEILLNRYLLKNAKTKEEKIFYLSKGIENYFTYVFKQTMYTEFENELYEEKQSNDLTSSLLSQKYGEIIKKYYGDVVSYDEIANIEWTRLGHLYRWSYYPYKYATGLLIASSAVHFLLDEKTVNIENYLKFLSSGSSLYPLELLKILSIDLTNPDIIEYGFDILEENIQELKKLFKK